MTQPSFIYYDVMDSPIGQLTIVSTDRGVCLLQYGPIDNSLPNIKAWIKKNGLKGKLVEDIELTKPVVKQLEDYFEGKRVEFDVPLDLYGTRFQKCVWKALQSIGYGETRSYKQVAQEIGAPKAVRAIGGANNQNPVPIIIPCHRVIGSNGAMVGYGGGLARKEALLNLEGSIEKIS
ncbi:methylated-DNA--[protein]-cysteine S-methyltransferase [Desertibacillus haloalkaliphilus]|uniref:methylated-DNA--[protein]-cysteine S-methyltransferase n=1 Tax=Desertibacillus haloalkaliphilus TaxID=1328930 RepID=UPI001C25CBFB|nr:methylated-DNA--[protein]-cysteine S-methyltransferase [Desertibacillus haloalkaliphilus]MBU8908936.1 methylated-DNA--[protein]-cysteine S-methyltransferase [Desertibacillus haloalkaliphilus]